MARSHEETIAAFVNGAKSPGDVGVIAHIEYGVRDRLVAAHDAAIKEMLGEPLPPEAAVSTAFRGMPRIFVSAKRTQMIANEPQEIRAFVLSSPKCTAVNLQWRLLGGGAFKTVAATGRARQSAGAGTKHSGILPGSVAGEWAAGAVAGDSPGA